MLLSTAKLAKRLAKPVDQDMFWSFESDPCQWSIDTASIDMFRETNTDDPLWQLVALAAGTGGSVLSIGSIAGVTLMSMEHVGFIWYFRKVGIWAALGFFSGIGVYQLERLIITGGS
ncbi:hypothetical protein AK812_SmicGene34548 [Symbiodinium microadriaticum]|uniref:Uncharacterized protein n=1 Tax=Symbiodinium microadriaticum TaxID=2951 RepID=A0A1Q9CNQ6_SYMMI|nr:hypothetical protein AK812_SmicGene34548 [Symbiodinium microadriaticum]